LKNIFKNCSKKDTDNYGIPDLIYFEENKIIIFECKYKNLLQAENDVKKKLKMNGKMNIIFIMLLILMNQFIKYLMKKI
jgi:hypothetical protein